MPLGNPQDYIKQGMSPGAAQAKAFPGGGGGSSTAARPLPTAPTSATQGIGGGPRGSNMTGAAQNLLSALQRLIQQGQQLGLMPQIQAMIQQAGTAAARRTAIRGPPRPQWVAVVVCLDPQRLGLQAVEWLVDLLVAECQDANLPE